MCVSRFWTSDTRRGLGIQVTIFGKVQLKFSKQPCDPETAYGIKVTPNGTIKGEVPDSVGY